MRNHWNCRLTALFSAIRGTMNRQSALVRLSDVAVNDVLPFARRLARQTRRVVDELAIRTLGPDFEERVERVRARYDAMGGDPFGLDLDFTKYVSIGAAVLHRLYFRTIVLGYEKVTT